MSREEVKDALRKFYMERMIEFLKSSGLEKMVDSLAEVEGPVEFNLKVEIPSETVQQLQKKLKGEG